MSSLLIGDQIQESRTTLRSLEWTAYLSHVVGDCLHVKIVPLPNARISIEVWLTGRENEELAYCRGMVFARDCRLKILWLGTRGENPVHETVRGWRCVSLPGRGTDSVAPRSADGAPKARPTRTVAEAIFGMVGAIAGGCLGVTVAELQAMDTGSGKLIALYERLGFQLCQKKESDMHWMEGPVDCMTVLAPESWYLDLVPSPTNFSGRAWMLEHLPHMKDEGRLLEKLRQHWEISLPWPAGGSRVRARLLLYDGEPKCRSGFHKFVLDAEIADASRFCYVQLRAHIWPERKLVHILHLGQARGKPAHKIIRRKKNYAVSSACAVTASVSLLGLAAAIGNWIGAEKMEMRVCDDGSGKIIPYFMQYGFTAVSPRSDDGAPAKLEALLSCLYNRCCPIAWRPDLPVQGDMLSMFVDDLDAADFLRYTRPTPCASTCHSAAQAEQIPAAPASLDNVAPLEQSEANQLSEPILPIPARCMLQQHHHQQHQQPHQQQQQQHQQQQPRAEPQVDETSQPEKVFEKVVLKSSVRRSKDIERPDEEMSVKSFGSDVSCDRQPLDIPRKKSSLSSAATGVLHNSTYALATSQPSLRTDDQPLPKRDYTLQKPMVLPDTKKATKEHRYPWLESEPEVAVSTARESKLQTSTKRMSNVMEVKSSCPEADVETPRPPRLSSSSLPRLSSYVTGNAQEEALPLKTPHISCASNSSSGGGFSATCYGAGSFGAAGEKQIRREKLTPLSRTLGFQDAEMPNRNRTPAPRRGDVGDPIDNLRVESAAMSRHAGFDQARWTSTSSFDALAPLKELLQRRKEALAW